MNSNDPHNSDNDARAHREARVLAFLLNDPSATSPDEHTAIEKLLAEDPALRAWHAELTSTLLPLLRENAAVSTAGLRMDAPRRASLLATLRTPSPVAKPAPTPASPRARPTRQRPSGPWYSFSLFRQLRLIEALAVLAIVAITATIFIPTIGKVRNYAPAASQERLANQEFSRGLELSADSSLNGEITKSTETEDYRSASGGSALLLPPPPAATSAPVATPAGPVPQIAFAGDSLSNASYAESQNRRLAEESNDRADISGAFLGRRALGDAAAARDAREIAAAPAVAASGAIAGFYPDEKQYAQTPSLPSATPAQDSIVVQQGQWSVRSSDMEHSEMMETTPTSRVAATPKPSRARSTRALGEIALGLSSIASADLVSEADNRPEASIRNAREMDSSMRYRTDALSQDESVRDMEKAKAAEPRSLRVQIAKEIESSIGSENTSEKAEKKRIREIDGAKSDSFADAPQKTLLLAETNAAQNPFSTFSLNVSDASFRLAEAALQQNRWPDASAIRTEEFVNALTYNDPPPTPGQAVSLTQEQARHPTEHNRNLLRLTLQTASAGRNSRQPLNLTLLLDTSGSMERADRQETVSVALDALADTLRPGDKLSLLGFARTPRLVIDGSDGPAAAAQLRQIARDGIPPEGGTNLEAALNAASIQNSATQAPAALNRIVLLTDGAANLGDANPANLAAIVERNKKRGVGLDCYGIGFDGYNDAMLEQLARAGYGRYAYLNNPDEARTDFAKKLAGSLQVAAQNVKVQVEFNPARVGSYRLLGYEKHRLRTEDFRDNTVAAAEIGAAESGTALYTVETRPDSAGGAGEIGMVRVRYQDPRTQEYHETGWIIPYDPAAPSFADAAPGLQLAASAGLFAEKLQNADTAQTVSLTSLAATLRTANARQGNFPQNLRLQAMIEEAARLDR